MFRDEIDTVELEGRIEHATEKAYLVDFVDGDKPIWLPKSLVSYISEEPEGLSAFEVPKWWAKKTDLFVD